MVELVDVRAAFPWLGDGPLFRVHTDLEATLRQDLLARDFEVLTLDGTAITSWRSAHDELALTFGFPDYYGRNWAAFTDSIGDFARARPQRRVAVFWGDISATGHQAPDVTAELGWVLLSLRHDWRPQLDATQDVWVQFEIFAVGDGPAFTRP